MDIASLKRHQNAEKMKIKRNVIRFLTESGKERTLFGSYGYVTSYR